MAHTAEPWKYGVRRDGSMWLSLGDPKTGPHYQGDLVASKDDANLIIATPKLLEALEAVEEWWLREGMNAFYGAPAAIFMARAAISEAKGNK